MDSVDGTAENSQGWLFDPVAMLRTLTSVLSQGGEEESSRY